MTEVQTLCCACVCIGVLTLVILMISSFSSLEYNEWGLDYSGITKTISAKAETGGIHFLGVGHSFIKFPKTVQTIEFSKDRASNGESLNSRTSDGLEVVLEISFQYILDADRLNDLYMAYGEHYKQMFILIAMDTLTDLATQYTAYHFFVDRQKIGTAMLDALNQAYKQYCYASVDFFQLRSVDLPDKFEDAIQLTEVKKQEIQRAQAEKNKTEVEFETLKLEALYQKNVTINLAKGESQARLAENNATVGAFKLVQGAKADSYKLLKDGLNYSSEDLLKFIKAKIIRDYDADGMSINIDAPTASSDKNNA